MHSQAQQRVYAACVQHGGGQAVCLQPHQPHMHFCTHVIHDPPTPGAPGAPVSPPLSASRKYAPSTHNTLTRKLLELYRFLVTAPLLDSTEASEAAYQQWLRRPPSSCDLLPLDVSWTWLEACLVRRRRVSEQSFLLLPRSPLLMCAPAATASASANDSGQTTSAEGTLKHEQSLSHSTHEQLYLQHVSNVMRKKSMSHQQHVLLLKLDLCSPV